LEWVPASQAPEPHSDSAEPDPSSGVEPSLASDLPDSAAQPETSGRRVAAGTGIPRPIAAGVLALFVLGIAVAAAAKASGLAVVVYLVLGLGLGAAVWYRSQRHLLMFRRENGRWPTLPESVAWNAEVQARSAKGQRVAASRNVLTQAERDYKQNVAAAEKALNGAKAAHAKAISDATGTVWRAEQDYQTKVAAAIAGLEQWQNPGRGALVGRFMNRQLYQHEIITGRGASTLLHSTANVAGNLLTIQAIQAQEVVRFDRKDEAAARAFAAQVNAAAFNEASFQQQRPSAIPAAEAYLQHVRADRGAIDAADSMRRQIEVDAAFLGAIATANVGLETSRADTDKVVVAQSALETEHASELKGPEVLAAPTWRPRSLDGGLAAGAIAVAFLVAFVVNAAGAPNVPSRQVAATTPSTRQISQAVPSPPAGPTPSTIPTQADLLGYGAIDSVWNSQHTMSTFLAPGCCYDPDPTLPQVNGHVAYKYFATEHIEGRVLGYQLDLPPQTRVGNARATVLIDFPTDTQVLWFKVKNSCAQEELQSAQIGAALSTDPNIGDPHGYVFVEFSTNNPDGTSGYEETNINNVIVSLGDYPTPGDGPAC